MPLIITDLAMGRVDRSRPVLLRAHVPARLSARGGAAKWAVNPIPIYTRSECVNSTASGCAERNSDLNVDAAVKAWNICIALIQEANPVIRKQLLVHLRQLIDCLLSIPVVKIDDTEDEDDEEEDEFGRTVERFTAAEKAQMVLVGSLKQQFYLAMVDVYAQKQWEKASTIVLEAFQHVPISLQKPLWKWRVIVMSKRGKSVLDGLQKLKESNPNLQARIYAILARSAAYPKQQLEAYKKTVEILNESIESVDYLLETCQWMSSASIPKSEIAELLSSVLDTIYEIEEVEFDPDDDFDADLQSETYSRSSSRNREFEAGSVGGKRAPKSIGGSNQVPEGVLKVLAKVALY